MPMAQESAYPLQSETDLRNILDELYAKSTQVANQSKSPGIKNLLEIAKSEIAIVTAIHNIKNNHGSQTTGTDDESITNVLQSQYSEVIERVRKMLDHYRPQPLRRVWIEKPGKPDKRPLGIPAIVDRVVQEVLRMIIEPILEAQFFKHSYGFRPLRDAHMALERIKRVSHQTGYHWIIEGDIRHCFDDINHTKLIKQLWHMGIHDQRVLQIIKEMLKAGVLGETNTTEQGTPQGGIISPIIANVYLHKLDQWIVREWEQKRTQRAHTRINNKLEALRKRSNLKPAYLIRYADDWVLITSTKANAVKWKQRIQRYLGTNLKLTLSEEKTAITDVHKRPIHFLGFRYRQRRGKSRTGWVSLTRPDDERLKRKVDELRQDCHRLRRFSGKDLIHQINLVNSKIVGVGQYYQPATMVNIELNKYADSLNYTAYKALKEKGGTWTPANQVRNLPARHAGYTTQIPAIEYEGLKIGVTSLGFVRWKRANLKNPIETPYTLEGRKALKDRTGRFKRKARDDPAMSLTLSALVAKGMTDMKYNFEYVMNRAYAYNRDLGVCRVCGEYVDPQHLNVHHQRPYLPLDQVNKVGELITLHVWCHQTVHNTEDVSQAVSNKVWKKIEKLREKLSR